MKAARTPVEQAHDTLAARMKAAGFTVIEPSRETTPKFEQGVWDDLNRSSGWGRIVAVLAIAAALTVSVVWWGAR